MNDKITELLTSIQNYITIATSWTTQSHKLWISTTPEDVTVKTLDSSNNMVDVVIPNMAKIIGNQLYIGNTTISVTNITELNAAVDSLYKKRIITDVTIEMAAGTYNLTQPLRFSDNSLTNKIIIKDIGTNKPILNVGSLISGLVIEGCIVEIDSLRIIGHEVFSTVAGSTVPGVDVSHNGRFISKDSEIDGFAIGINSVNSSVDAIDSYFARNETAIKGENYSVIKFNNIIITGPAINSLKGVVLRESTFNGADLNISDLALYAIQAYSSNVSMNNCQLQSDSIIITAINSSLTINNSTVGFTSPGINSSSVTGMLLTSGSSINSSDLAISHVSKALILAASVATFSDMAIGGVDRALLVHQGHMRLNNLTITGGEGLGESYATNGSSIDIIIFTIDGSGFRCLVSNGSSLRLNNLALSVSATCGVRMAHNSVVNLEHSPTNPAVTSNIAFNTVTVAGVFYKQ